MKSLYAQYVKERENLDEIATDRGFIHYRFENGECWINDYFVSKEFRKSGHGYFLANQVFALSKENGIKLVFCQTDSRAIGSDLSKFTIENFGFEHYATIGTINYYKMEVSEWEKR